MNDAKASANAMTGSARMSAEGLAGVPGVSAAKDQKMPALVYFYVRSGEEKSPSIKACRSMELDLFAGRNKRVGLLARYFQCTRVNVDGITPKQDPVFNGQSAPLLLVTAADGSRVALLPGKVSEADLVGAMQAALQKSGINGAAITAQGEPLLSQIRKLEDERIRLRLKVSLAASRPNGGDAKGQAELDQVEKTLAETYKALESLGKPKAKPA
jgi:hypothetical protein